MDCTHDGLRFLMGRIFDTGVECRRDQHGCDHSHCTKISALVTYLRRNFVAEEALMSAAGYPHAADHRRDHWRVVEELQGLQAARLCGERDRALVRQVINRWVSHHHQGCDHPLGRWAATRRLVPAG
jgi:hemerythrin-like metal-binding protein